LIFSTISEFGVIQLGHFAHFGNSEPKFKINRRGLDDTCPLSKPHDPHTVKKRRRAGTQQGKMKPKLKSLHLALDTTYYAVTAVLLLCSVGKNCFAFFSTFSRLDLSCRKKA
jgi:hypothetical protein